MLLELKTEQFERVRSLFQGFDYSLSVQAAIEGNNPGRIFVDDIENPRTGFALTVEGYLLAGEDSNPETINALRRFLKEKIFTGEFFVNGNDSLSLAVHPVTWEARLPQLIPSYEALKIQRYHYVCREVKFDWRKHVPQGYSVHHVDKNFFENSQIVFPDEMREWFDIEEMWWTKENFFSKGISFAVVHEGEIVSWCTPDCVAGDQIDVGIITLRAHRRRGLAAIAVAATVEQCFNKGYKAVGWHCNVINTASWKVAEKVGFERHREYAYYDYIYDPVDHLAELGWYYYQLGEYARTTQYYEQVFILREENPDYYYHLTASAWALLSNKEKTVRYLQAALDHGWAHLEWTKEQKEFCIIHDTPVWQRVTETNIRKS
jgi:RimJ/RimL family protein N-acetyltransferase